MNHLVDVSKEALAQMLLNGFEAFVIKHGGNKRSGIEFHASLYGDIDIDEENEEYHNRIQFVSVDTSAEMASGSVGNKAEAEDLKEDIAEQLGYYRLGNMHSHPYLKDEMPLDEVRERGCLFSEADEEFFLQELDKYNLGAYILELVLTIKQLEKQNTARDGRIDDQVIEFSVGNCKCFLRAQAFSKTDDGELIEEPTQLICEYLEEFTYIGADFGRVAAKENRKRVLEYKPR